MRIITYSLTMIVILVIFLMLIDENKERNYMDRVCKEMTKKMLYAESIGETVSASIVQDSLILNGCKINIGAEQ